MRLLFPRPRRAHWERPSGGAGRAREIEQPVGRAALTGAVRPVSASRSTLIAFPHRGTAYNECLYAAMQALGATVVEGDWSGRWLKDHVQRGDAVHVHWPSFFYHAPGSWRRTAVGLLRFVALVLLVRWRGGRVLWTAHNLYPHRGGRHLWAHRVARRFIVAASERIFAHGQAAATLVQREFGVPAHKVVAIPHGHWADHYPPAPPRIAARRQLGLPPASFVYGFVGGCEPYKGLEDLIRAFSELSGNPVLVIAGRFRSEAYLQTITDLLARLPAERVLFAPRHIRHEEIPVYLAAVDVLVTPFREILTSGSVMLGLSFGRPVIAPRTGGVVDAMDHRHGILYDPGLPSALRWAMDEIRAMSFDAVALVEHARGFHWSDAASAVIAAVESHPRWAGRSLSPS